MAGSIFEGFSLTDTLKNFQTSTSTAMSKVKENTLNPMDTTGDSLKQGVALLKPTDTSVTKNITSYKSVAVSELDGIIGMLSGGFLNTKAITNSIKIGPNGIGLDTDSILAAASQEAGFPVSGKSSAMRKLANGVSSQFKKLTGVDMGQLIQSNNGKGFSVNGDWRSLLGTETLRQISSLTGIDEFIDVSVQTALYNTVMDSAARLGMRDSYKSIYDLYKDTRSADEMLVDAVRIMITNGDIESIDTVVNMMDQTGVNAINAAYPELIETLFRSFHFASNLMPEDYPALRAKLLALLTRICGPSWWMRSTQFGPAYNLGIIHTVSPDMITLLNGMEELAPLLCAAGLYTDRNAISELKMLFREAPVFNL